MDDFQSLESVVLKRCAHSELYPLRLSFANGGDLILSTSEKAVFLTDDLNAFSGCPSEVIGLFVR